LSQASDSLTGCSFVLFQGSYLNVQPLCAHKIKLSSNLSNNEAEAWAIASVVLSLHHSILLANHPLPKLNEFLLENFSDIPADLDHTLTLLPLSFTQLISNTCHIYIQIAKYAFLPYVNLNNLLTGIFIV
jgi:hypothetical protein